MRPEIKLRQMTTISPASGAIAATDLQATSRLFLGIRTTRAVAITIACDASFDVVVVDLGVEERFDASFEPQLGIIDFAARFDELGHAHAEHVNRGLGLRFVQCHDVRRWWEWSGC